MSCRSTGRCILPTEGAIQVLTALRAADAIVIGAPCYWGGMPGTLKVLLDRLVYAFIDTSRGLRPRPLLVGKRAAILTTCTTPFPFNIVFNQSSGTQRSIAHILRFGGLRLVGKVTQSGTHRQRKLSRRNKRAAIRLLDKLLPDYSPS